MVSPVSSTNKTVRHDIPELLLKVALNTINNDYSQTCIKRSLKQVTSKASFNSFEIVYDKRRQR
jgi:hypothetical protein